jgi:capsular exopolysaccharide synthesis family protein
MELRHHLVIVWRGRWLIVLAVAASVAAALAFSARAAPVYEAEAKIFIGPRAAMAGDLSAALEELSFSREFLGSYAELLKSRPLAERVVEVESLSAQPAELVNRIKTQIIPDTRIIELSVTDSSAAGAQRIANALAEIFVSEGVQEFGGAAGVRARILEPALRPTRPVSPNPRRDGLLGGGLGLALGVGMAFLLAQLDTTLRSRDEVERALAPIPVLAAIPRGSRKRKRVPWFELDPMSPTAEAFRTLRTNLLQSSAERPLRRVLVTSPCDEEGKTTVAVNLAASMASAGINTILVESDLRRPVAHEYFGTPASPGITDAVFGRCEITQAIQRTGIANLAVLPAGTLPPNPSEVLASRRMTEVLEKASGHADVLILDSPPALAVADASVVAPHVDGVILVVRSRRTHLARAQEAKSAFLPLPVGILGVVINDVSPDRDHYNHRYYRRSHREQRRRHFGRRKRRQKQWSFEESPRATTVFPGFLPPKGLGSARSAAESPVAASGFSPRPQPAGPARSTREDSLSDAPRQPQIHGSREPAPRPEPSLGRGSAARGRHSDEA